MARRRPCWLERKPTLGKDTDGREYWLLRATDPATGKRVSRPLGWMTQQAAEDELEKVRARILLGQESASPSTPAESERPRRRFVDFLEVHYLPRVRADSAAGTLHASRRALQHFARLIGDPYLDEVTTATVMDFEARRRAEKVSPRTVYLDLRELRLALQLAHRLGYIAVVPSFKDDRRGRKRHATRVRSHDVPTPEQFQRLVEAAHPSLRLFLLLAGRCGLREGEACSRDWFDVEVRGDAVWLRIGDKPEIGWATKTATSRRTIPVPPEVARELMEARPASGAGWLFPSRRADRRDRYADDLVRLCRKVLGQDGPIFRAHAYRRFFATECARRGVALKDCMAYGGWERMETLVEIYQQADAQDLKRVAFRGADRGEGDR